MEFIKAVIKLWAFQSIVIVVTPDSEEEGDDEDFPFKLWKDVSLEFPHIRHTVIEAEELLSLSLDEGIQGIFVKGPLDKSIQESLSERNSFLPPLCWLIHRKDGVNLKNLRLDSCVFLYEDACDNCTTVTMEEVYSIKGGPNTILNYGSWTGGKDSSLSVSEKVWTDRRRDFAGIQLSNVVTDLNIHHMVTFDEDSGAIADVEGLFVDILMILSDSLNFTVAHVSPRELTFGVVYNNGTATGMIGSLARREADLSATLLTIAVDRGTVVDFSKTVLLDKTTLTTKKSKGRKIDFLAYLGVFSWTCWLALGFYVLVLSLGLVAITGQSGNGAASIGPVASLTLVGLHLLQMDNPYDDVVSRQQQSSSLRILCLTTSLSSFVLFGFYTALLTSLMTVQSPASSLEHFVDVLDSDYSLVVVDNSFSYDTLASALPGSVLDKMFKSKIVGNPNSRLGSHEECFKTLKYSGTTDSTKLAYFGSGLVMHQLDAHEEFVQVLDIRDAIVQPIAFAFVKGSELTEIFNSHLLKMDQSGLINKLKHKWMPWIAAETFSRSSAEAAGAPGEEEEALLSLSYENVLFLFAILLSGPLFACIIAFVEKAKFAVVAWKLGWN